MLKTMKRYFAIASLLLLVATILPAQNRNVARKHFLAGEYAEAKPMFEKLLKRNPRNSEYSYWYAVCCYETKDTTITNMVELLEFAASRKITNAYRYLGDILADSAKYSAAADRYEEFLSLSKDDSLLALYRTKLNRVNRLDRMVRTTEKVCVIDSFVVDKENFLSAYKMGRDVARLYSVATFFDEEDEDGGYLSETERGTDIYYAMKQEGEQFLKLYHCSKIGEEWSRAAKLQGLDTKGNDNYPFMLSDGLTLYFASDGEESIGGYDIFITRYDSERERYLRPDNVGMPFNSIANDYMLAINEVANLGWFATDRNQPEGKVCIYVFVPNETKERYNAEELSYEQILSFSQLNDIASTQTDEDVVRNARRQFTMLLYEQPENESKGDFLFVIDNATDYTSLKDFKNMEARTLFQKWQKATKQYKLDCETLQKRRDTYATATTATKERMKAEILQLEQKVDNDFYFLRDMEYEIRRLELEKIQK